MRKEFFCPTDDWDCPYCEKDGLCALGASAIKECDEAAAFFCEDEEDEEMAHAPAVIHRHTDGSWS